MAGLWDLPRFPRPGLEQFNAATAAQRALWPNIRARARDTPTKEATRSATENQIITFNELQRHLKTPGIGANAIGARNLEYYLELICLHQNRHFTKNFDSRPTRSSRATRRAPTPFLSFGFGFWEALEGPLGNAGGTQYIRSRYPHLGAKGFRENFDDYLFIFIPIKIDLQNSTHSMLLVVCPHLGTMEFFDSREPPGIFLRGGDIFFKMLEFLKFELDDGFRFFEPFTRCELDWGVRIRNGSQGTANNEDSVVYCATNAFLIAFGFGDQIVYFTPEDVSNKRKRMASELLSGDLRPSLPVPAAAGEPENPVHQQLGLTYDPATLEWTTTVGFDRPSANRPRLTLVEKKALRRGVYAAPYPGRNLLALKAILKAEKLRPVTLYTSGLTLVQSRYAVEDGVERKRYRKQRAKV